MVLTSDMVSHAVLSTRALLPALAGLGAAHDGPGMSILLDCHLAELESVGLPREFCYRLVIGMMATALGHHVDRDEIDLRLLDVLGEQT